eukprot:168389_1
MSTSFLLDLDERKQIREECNIEQKIAHIQSHISSNHDAECIPFSDTDTTRHIRNVDEISTYLEHYIPAYINLSSLLSSLGFVLIPLMTNLGFIISNFIIMCFNNNDSHNL